MTFSCSSQVGEDSAVLLRTEIPRYRTSYSSLPHPILIPWTYPLAISSSLIRYVVSDSSSRMQYCSISPPPRIYRYPSPPPALTSCSCLWLSLWAQGAGCMLKTRLSNPEPSFASRGGVLTNWRAAWTCFRPFHKKLST